MGKNPDPYYKHDCGRASKVCHHVITQDFCVYPTYRSRCPGGVLCVSAAGVPMSPLFRLKLILDLALPVAPSETHFWNTHSPPGIPFSQIIVSPASINHPCFFPCRLAEEATSSIPDGAVVMSTPTSVDVDHSGTR